MFLLYAPVQGATSTSDDMPGERLVVTGTCADGDAVEPIKTGDFYVESILWLTPATIGDDLDLEDANGKVIFQVKCVVANQSMVIYPRTVVRGLSADQLDSGSVVVFYRTERPKGLK